MPLGSFERQVLKVIAENRNPDSYIGGATVLHQSPSSMRSSRDVDVFHDSSDMLDDAVSKDQASLEGAGYAVEIRSAFPGFVRALVSRNGQRTRIEWVFDSAFRFFPVEADEELGYRLNFWDAATNKVLAAAGRAEIRDYVDLLDLHEHHLSLGALIWAASGKDAGLTPALILAELSRVQRYSTDAYKSLSLANPVDPGSLKALWLSALEKAEFLLSKTLRHAPMGCLFLNEHLVPTTPTSETLPALIPHFGSLRGCLPRIGPA